MPTKGNLITYREDTDTFNLSGPNGEEIMTFSPEELRKLVVEGARLLHDRSLFNCGKDDAPLNDSAEVPHREA